MERAFHPLPLRELGAGAGLRRPTQPQAARVTPESPALAVMTDLTRVSPATIRPRAPLSGANQFMIARGVRLLLVTDDAELVLGVLTASDILGERPMVVATGRGVRRDELAVADVMTPAAEVRVVELGDVAGACVGHVLETLRSAGRQHALVVDFDSLPEAGVQRGAVRRTMVRGILSASQIARQLGVSPPAGAEVALSFSEIEAALVK